LSDTFSVENGLKQGDALTSFILNFSLEYAIGKVQETHVGLKLNGTYQFLICADGINVFGDNIYAIKKNTEPLIGASKEGEPHVSTEPLKMWQSSNILELN
jgi:hypothetical protein